MGEGAQHARGELADGLIDGDHSADVQGGVAVIVVAREDFEFRVQHGEFARVAVELDLAEERHLHAFGQHVGEISAVEPLAHQDGARGIREAGFEHAQVAAPESGELGRTNLGDHRGHLARRKLRDGLDVAAVLVAERDVAQQVLGRDQPLGFEQGRAGRADSLDVCERGIQIHAARPMNPVYPR